MECEHSQHWGMDECPGLTPAEMELGERIRSISLNFVACGGKDDWHGETVKERVDEHFARAKEFGNEPPQYEGRAVLR